MPTGLNVKVKNMKKSVLFKQIVLAVMLIVLLALVSCSFRGCTSTHSHTVTGELIIVKEATCAEEGVAHMFCTSCGEIVNTVTLAKTNNHKEIIIPAVGATCENTGLTEGAKCSVCDEVLLPQQELPILAHKYDDKYDDTCNECGYIRDAECPHSETKIVAGKDATCTEIGYTDGEKCKKCSDIIVEQKVIPATGHRFSEWNNIIEATTTEEGLKERTCFCGEKQVETIPIIRIYVRDGDYIYFGEYPQTIKADNVTITTVTDSRGYYLGSDGSYYAKVKATPYNVGLDFSSGETIDDGKIYYFKVEPIRWKILSEEDGVAFILCDSIIENVPYQQDCTKDNGYGYTSSNGAPEGTYANNYKYSDVRAWLNSTFYKTAFSTLQQEIILTTEVDNSVSSIYYYGYTGTMDDIYTCENTYDKVFLLSRSEVTNAAYGFSTDLSENDVARRVWTSDYSRAIGIDMVSHGSYYYEYYGHGGWWLRSPPGNSYAYRACSVHFDGDAYYANDVDYTILGVVPALRITL